MNYKKAIKIIIKTRKRLVDDKIWEKYLADYQNMDKDNFISFEDYKKKIERYAESKLRTPAKKEKFKQEARKKAQLAIQKIDPHNNMKYHMKLKNIKKLIEILKERRRQLGVI